MALNRPGMLSPLSGLGSAALSQTKVRERICPELDRGLDCRAPFSLFPPLTVPLVFKNWAQMTWAGPRWGDRWEAGAETWAS